MIVGSRIDSVEIPHETGNFIKLRELSGLEMDEAQELRSQSILKKMGALGKETLDAIRTENKDPQPMPVSNPNEDYDWQYIIDKAIVGWEGPNYASVVCDESNKRLLDKTTRNWVVEEIIKRNTVPMGESSTSEGYLKQG